MNADEQGTRHRGKHLVVPRTLVFVTSINPETGAEEMLLLLGASAKRLWAGKYNGLGGHVEADEDVESAALREVREETGLQLAGVTLCGVVHIDTGDDAEGPRPGVMMFVLRGQTTERTVQPTAEGVPAWVPIGRIATLSLVDDLYELIPRVLAAGRVFYGHYAPDNQGRMHHRFVP